jgi:iodotyrosine deiodinase
MLDIEKSFFIQHWEFVVLFISIVYFVVRLRDNRKSSEDQRQVNDEETIENDARDGDVDNDTDDLTPSLEDVGHVPFKGASVVLKGGVQEFYNMASDRRSIRMFSRKHVDIEIVKKCIHAAGTAPSGAHTEPWKYCLVKR